MIFVFDSWIFSIAFTFIVKIVNLWVESFAKLSLLFCCRTELQLMWITTRDLLNNDVTYINIYDLFFHISSISDASYWVTCCSFQLEKYTCRWSNKCWNSSNQGIFKHKCDHSSPNAYAWIFLLLSIRCWKRSQRRNAKRSFIWNLWRLLEIRSSNMLLLSSYLKHIKVDTRGFLALKGSESFAMLHCANLDVTARFR